MIAGILWLFPTACFAVGLYLLHLSFRAYAKWQESVAADFSFGYTRLSQAGARHGRSTSTGSPNPEVGFLAICFSFTSDCGPSLVVTRSGSPGRVSETDPNSLRSRSSHLLELSPNEIAQRDDAAYMVFLDRRQMAKADFAHKPQGVHGRGIRLHPLTAVARRRAC
jgi:hypothetical protein